MEKDQLEVNIKDVKKESPGFGIRHVQVMVMCIASMTLYMIRSCMGVAILNMTDQSQTNNTDVEIYTWSEEIRGVILSSFFWGYVVMQIPAGVMAKRFGGKPLMLAGLLCSGTLCLITPMLTKWGDWMAMCAVRVLMGLTQACLLPCTHTMLGKWAPPQERSVMTVIAYMGIQIGTVITMPICGILSSTFLGWKLIFYTIGSLGFLTAILFWALTGSSPRENRLIKEPEIKYIETSLDKKEFLEEPPIPWKKLFTSVPVFAVICAHLGIGYCFTLFLVETPTYLKSGLGIDMTQSAILSALPFFCQWISQCSASYLSDFIVNRKIISVTNSRKLFNSLGSVGMAACLIGLSFLDRSHKILSVSLICCSMGVLGFTNCGYMLNLLDLTPNFAGITYAISNCLTSIISVFAPISTGYILGDDPTDHERWRIVFCSAAAIIIASNLTYIILGTAEIQPWNELENVNKYALGLLKKKSIVDGDEIRNCSFNDKDDKKENLC